MPQYPARLSQQQFANLDLPCPAQNITPARNCSAGANLGGHSVLRRGCTIVAEATLVLVRHHLKGCALSLEHSDVHTYKPEN